MPLPMPLYPAAPRRRRMLHDLITAILVATAAVIASSLLDRIWDAL